MQDKLTAWKAKHLSFAGRLTLAKPVIEALPLYSMMTASIPKSCLNEIHRLQRSFIWGDDEDTRKYHGVQWNVLTQPKCFGGSGLRKLDVVNEACIMKLCWSFRQNEEALWCAVLRGKYGRDLATSHVMQAKSGDSSLWKNLVKCCPKLSEFEICCISNGR